MSQETFILVHGAFHGGWCWAEVAEGLRAKGHLVFCPSLTGLGDRSHLASEAVTLRTHILDIANIIRWEGLDQVILCGHSYAGMVISGVAEELPEGTIRTLVYLDAILPQNGLALVDYPPPQNTEGRGFRTDAALGLVYPPDPTAFGLNEEQANRIRDRITPHPLGTFVEKLSLSGAIDRVANKTYVLCTRSGGLSYLDQCAETARQLPGWQVETLDSGHDVMIEAPGDVVDLLLRSA